MRKVSVIAGFTNLNYPYDVTPVYIKISVLHTLVYPLLAKRSRFPTLGTSLHLHSKL